MSERTVQTVTPRQLRREFNGIGLTFLIVFGLAVGAAFGYQWLTPLLEPYYQTVDRQAAEMGIRIVVTLLVMLLPFQIYAALKKMKTGRFFGHCQGEWRDILGLVLIGLALNLLLTFIVGILALVLSWSNIQFTSSELILQGKASGGDSEPDLHRCDLSVLRRIYFSAASVCAALAGWQLFRNICQLAVVFLHARQPDQYPAVVLSGSLPGGGDDAV